MSIKIGIILGSIRSQRATEGVATFIAEAATSREGAATYELIDLATFNVPLLTSSVHPMAANKSYDDANVQRWSDAIDACDGFIFVTPEYNHGVPGAFKNAFDSLGHEWVGKPVAFVSHGSVSGVRSVEQWKGIVATFGMPVVGSELNFQTHRDWTDGAFAPADRDASDVLSLCDDLERYVTGLSRR